MSPCELWTFFDRHSDPPPLLRLPDPLVLPTSSPNFPTCQDELDSFRMNSKQLIVGWWCVYVSKITIIYIYIHYIFKLNTFDCSLLQCLTEALKTKLSKLFKKHTFENSDVKSNQIKSNQCQIPLFSPQTYPQNPMAFVCRPSGRPELFGTALLVPWDMI